MLSCFVFYMYNYTLAEAINYFKQSLMKIWLSTVSMVNQYM